MDFNGLKIPEILNPHWLPRLLICMRIILIGLAAYYIFFEKKSWIRAYCCCYALALHWSSHMWIFKEKKQDQHLWDECQTNKNFRRCINGRLSGHYTTYRKVASSSMSCLVAHPSIFRMFMKGKFDACVLWPLAAKLSIIE